MSAKRNRYTLGRVSLATFGILFILAVPVRAQYTADSQANVISGVTSNWSGDYIVGSNTYADVLLILNGGVLSNDNGYVGYEENSSNNNVLVIGSGSVWSNNTELSVGVGGASNQLTIAAGGQVFSSSVGLGSGISSYGNRVYIDGPGSVMSGDGLQVGGSGAGNSFVISNGARLISGESTVGDQDGASANRVVVTGLDSVWECGGFTIGAAGAGNSLLINNGGKVVSGGASVGFGDSASNNCVVVTDPGSVWSNGWSTIIGAFGINNNLVISNGASVFSGYQGFIGGAESFDIGTNNVVVVTGAGSSWTVSGWLRINNGNRLFIDDGAQVFSSDGFVGDMMGDTSVLVTGAGSVWSNSGSVYIGYVTDNNHLVISNGGHVVDATGFIGAWWSTRDDHVLVTGSGSEWRNAGELFVGRYGTGNCLVISNAAKVADGYGYVGYGYATDDSYGNSNSVCVVDGAVWQNSVLDVAYYGYSNSLVVAGGSVLATNLVIGFNSANCDNRVQLDSGSIIVTNATHDAVLEVRNGQFVLNGGTLQVDRLVVTNDCAQFLRNGGTLLYSQLALDPNQDTDGDGMPNGYEQSHGFDPLNPADANQDADGDGLSNLQEYIAGTDPTNSASSLRITSIAQEGNDIRVTWNSVSNHWYYVQTNSAPTSGSYTNSFTDFSGLIWASATNAYYLHSGGVTNKPALLYRVRLYSGPI